MLPRPLLFCDGKDAEGSENTIRFLADGVTSLTAANHIYHEARFLGGDTHIARFRPRQRNCFFRCHYFAAFSVDFAACPLNVRVGENSPNLWPTMFSVTYTGINFLPL